MAAGSYLVTSGNPVLFKNPHRQIDFHSNMDTYFYMVSFHGNTFNQIILQPGNHIFLITDLLLINFNI